MNGLMLEEVQEKAWKSFVRAVKKCKKTGIYFYQVLDAVSALNGHNVKSIHPPDDIILEGMPKHIYNDNRNLNGFLYYPSINITDAFADDMHYVRLKTD